MLSFCFMLLLLGKLTAALEFDQCDDGVKAPNSLYVYGCHEQPCTFAIGSNVIGDVNFTVGEEATDLKMEMTLDHNGSLVSFPVPGIHICSGLGQDECRFESGVNANYYFLFNVNVDIPNEDLVSFKMVMTNQNGTKESCCEFKGKIVSPDPEAEP